MKAGKAGLRELALQNLSKAHYLGAKLKRRFTGPYFNEFVAVTGDPAAVNRGLEQKKIIGGLPLERFYPELGNASLWCATETTTREQIDKAAKVLTGSHSNQPTLVHA